MPLRPRSFLPGTSSAAGRIPSGIVTGIEQRTVGIFAVLVGITEQDFSERRQIGVGGGVVDPRRLLPLPIEHRLADPVVEAERLDVAEVVRRQARQRREAGLPTLVLQLRLPVVEPARCDA